MRKIIEKIDLAILCKLLLLVLDIMAINFSSYIAIWLRFNQSLELPDLYIQPIMDTALFNTIVTIVLFTVFKLYTSLWRFASVKELVYIIQSCAGSVIFNIIFLYANEYPVFRSYFVMYPAALFLLTCSTRFSYRLLRLLYRGRNHGQHMRHTMIIGAGEACNVVMKELELSLELDAKICCIIDDDVKKHRTHIHGVKVVGGRDKILAQAKKYDINEIIIAIPSISKKELSKLLEICKNVHGCELKILPGVYQLVNGEVSVSKLRNVQIEDLLGRAVTPITTEKVGKYVAGKTVLVTGGGGSIGSELCRQLAANGVGKLIILDIYENNAYDIQQELRNKCPNLDLVVLIGSVRNGRKLDSVFAQYRPDIVYHAAAHKHVPLMETSPNEAIKNNVFGTYKTAFAADKYRVEKFVLISTDKAVNPTNIMGASKRMCEMVIQVFSHHSDTEFAAVRFGNVLGSNGSVIPLFRKQMEAGGPVTVTHPDIIRYFMTIPEAVSLVLQAGANAKGGEIFVLDMGEPVKIAELAKNLIKLSGYKLGIDMDIEYTGLRPGEKLYEELLMSEEGLESTENELIHIGKPIDFDEEEFVKELNNLYKEAYAETEEMKVIVKRIVPTYNLRQEDINLDKAIQDTWKSDYPDASSHLPNEFMKVVVR